MGNKTGFIYILRCKHFLNKLNYYQLCLLLDMARQRKKFIDSEIQQGKRDSQGRFFKTK